MGLFDAALQPITADDDALRGCLADAEVPALLMTVAHLTGDLSVLRDDCRPSGWLFLPQGGLSAEVQERAREAALRALIRLRDTGAAPPRPTAELIRAITSWAMGTDTEHLVALLSEEIAPAGEDPKAPRWTLADIAERDTDFRVAIVGAGMSGLLAGYRLSQAGVPFVIYEKNGEVGGTWFENTYPGCRVDVPSHLYSYSFAPRLDWPDHFCTRDELLTYFRDFAKESGVHEHIRFDSEVRAAEWDERRGRWLLTVRTQEGEETAECAVFVTAVGQLNRPKLPDIPGRERFGGPAFHSAGWDHSVDLAGRRVAVVGTGASAFQLIPEIADTAAELVVFQRTPPWLRPTPHYHHPVSPGTRWLYEHVPYYAQWYRFWLFAPGLHGVLEGWVVDPDYPPTERAVSALNEQLRATLAAGMEAQLADAPELRPHVMPRYPVGAKRVLRDNGAWLGTLKRDDVRLVTERISEITAGGVRTADGTEHRVDVIVYGTGFEASRFLMPMRVTGRGGVDLHEMWDGDARAHLGMTVPGFPNMFQLYGPNTNLSGQGGSIIYFSECAVTHLLDAVRLLLVSGCRALEVRSEVYEEYNARVDEGNANRAWGWSSVGSWFINDKGRSAQNWPFTAHDFWKRTHRVDRSAYDLR